MGEYSPTWVEISILIAAFAGFGLLYTVFSKFFPIVSINDMLEGEHHRTHVRVGRATFEATIREE